MKNFFSKIGLLIKNSYFKLLTGKENYWIIALIWGLGLYVLSLIIGFVLTVLSISLNSTITKSFDIKITNPMCFESEVFSACISRISSAADLFPFLIKDLILIPFGMVGFLAYVFIYIYPMIIAYALVTRSMKSASNTGKIIYFIISVILLVILLTLNLAAFKLIIFGAIMLTVASISGAILMMVIFLFAAIKTVKILRNKEHEK